VQEANFSQANLKAIPAEEEKELNFSEKYLFSNNLGLGLIFARGLKWMKGISSLFLNVSIIEDESSSPLIKADSSNCLLRFGC